MKRFTLFEGVNNTLLILLALVCVYPFANMVAVSLSDGGYVVQGQVYLIPRGINIETYQYILGTPRLGILRGLLNSFLYTGLGTLFAVVLTSMTAYSLSRKRLPGRYVIMAFILFTMVFDGGLIPSYLVNNALGLVNSIWVMVFPGAISVFLLIITRTFFEEIPVELEESAVIDGAGEFTILRKIFIQLSRPVLATIGIFYAVNVWNSFLTPLIYFRDRSMYPIQLILYNLVIKPDTGSTRLENVVQDGYQLLPDNIEAGVIFLAILPILFVYPFAQKYFTKGMMIGSIKG